jgi:tRNA threonylcarbamoyladenosine biosynthesis protein TsaE
MNRDKIINEILSLLPKKRIFLLEGELGAGKTTLIKFFAKKLQIKETLTSPTFILWQKYQFKLKNKNFFLNHLDLYRVKAGDILKIDLKKEIYKEENVFFIEWGEKLKPFLKRKKFDFVEIIIKKKNNKREYLLKYSNNESGFN